MLNFKKIDNVTYKQIDIMKHTIGFNRGRIRGTKYRRYAPYRNYFDAGSADIASIESLVEIGLMKEYRKNWFEVTDDGREFLELVTGVTILAAIDTALAAIDRLIDIDTFGAKDARMGGKEVMQP